MQSGTRPTEDWIWFSVQTRARPQGKFMPQGGAELSHAEK